MTKFELAIIGVEYKEPYPGTYTGVSLKLTHEMESVIKTVVNTGKGATHDYTLASRAARLLANIVMCSSSVDHFTMDGGENVRGIEWTL